MKPLKRLLWTSAAFVAGAVAAAGQDLPPEDIRPESRDPGQASDLQTEAATVVVTRDATATAATLRDINPFDRDVPMTVPLNFNERILGEVPILLTADDQIFIESAGFIELLTPLLTSEAQASLEGLLAGRDRFLPGAIEPIGIGLDYDPNLLSLLLLRVRPELRAVESLFASGAREEPGLPPNDFAAHLNGTTAISRRESTNDFDDPSFYLDGAVNWRNLVFEANVQGREDFGTGDYEVFRRYARFVFDQPQSYRRWYLGDLDPQIRMRQGFVDLGGIGMDRQRRRFDPYRYAVLQGDRQLLLSDDATVSVYRNGALLREFRLDAGQYDLSQLPLETGSNDLEIVVEDATGVVQTLNYSSYLDPIDLEPGDYEYAAYLGVIAPPTFGDPDYSDGELAFTGFFRKAFVNRPALGVGLQASGDAQMISAQSQLVLPNGSRLQGEGAASHSELGGEGYAASLQYNMVISREDRLDGLVFQAEYTSEDFATIADPRGANPISWSFNGQYTTSFTNNLFAQLSGSYNVGRGITSDSYRLGASATYQFSPEWSVRGGVDYVKFASTSTRDGVGFSISLVWRPGRQHRANVRYDSRTNSASASYVKSPTGAVGSFGYAVQADYSDGPVNLSGSGNYIGNRFDAGLSHVMYGRDFENIGDEQVTTLRVGSALAFTGGRFGIGRRVGDSFALMYPHESLEGRSVVVGESVQGGYYAKSGAFGSALNGYLGSYVNNSIYYDVEDVPTGYDIGDGVVIVHPRYRSGYDIEVGSSAYVSALGTVQSLSGAPVGLASGNIYDLTDPEAPSELFFTNSVGRFAIQSLTPGRQYRVELNTSPPSQFEFEVPADSPGLLDLETIRLPVVVTD